MVDSVFSEKLTSGDMTVKFTCGRKSTECKASKLWNIPLMIRKVSTNGRYLLTKKRMEPKARGWDHTYATCKQR